MAAPSRCGDVSLPIEPGNGVKTRFDRARAG